MSYSIFININKQALIISAAVVNFYFISINSERDSEMQGAFSIDLFE